jgi:hypothetical protein
MVYTDPYKNGLISQALLSENRFVRMTAKSIDIKIASVKYPLYFYHEKINLWLDVLNRVVNSKLHPIIRSRIICILQQRILALLLLYEKVKRYLDHLLSKKLKWTIKTIMFAITFGFICFAIHSIWGQRYALTNLRRVHHQFLYNDLRLAFVDPTKYGQFLFGVNLFLYGLQLMLLLGYVDPGYEARHLINTCTVGSTVAGFTYGLTYAMPAMQGTAAGNVITSLHDPKKNVGISALFAAAYYLGFNNPGLPVNDAIGTVVTNTFLAKEQELWEQVRTGINVSPKGHLAFLNKHFFDQHCITPDDISDFAINGTYDYNKLYRFFLNLCNNPINKELPSAYCASLSGHANSIITQLIKEGYVEKRLYDVFEPKNPYRAANITGLSFQHLACHQNVMVGSKVTKIEEGNVILSWWLLKLLVDS